MNDRILSLRNKMAGLNLQGMIISNPTNVKYFTGLEAEGVLLITRKENIYITDSRYIEYVSNTITPFDEIVVDDFKNISKDDYENFLCSAKMLDLKKITLHMHHTKNICIYIKLIILLKQKF